MNKGFRCFFQFAILLTFIGTCFATGKGEVELAGDTSKTSVRLLWQAQGWPDGVLGFNVKRRLQGGDTWQRLSASPICPEISKQRNWADQGLDAKQIETIQQKLNGYLEESLFRLISRDEFHEQLQKLGMRSGDRIRMNNDFDLALILGFGFIDSTILPDQNYEYGLFTVTVSGTESALPVDTYLTLRVNLDEVKVALTAEQNGHNVELTWETDAALYDQLGLLTYNIYRKKNQDDEWVRIIPPSISPAERDENTITWCFQDEEADAYQSWYYAVAPYNKFQTELAKSWVKYEPKEWAPAKISALTVLDEYNVSVSWDIADEMKPMVQGFYVLRSSSTNDFQQVGPAQSPEKRRMQDDSPPSRADLSYKVVTIDLEGNEFISDAQSVYFEGIIVPDTPKNLKLSFFQKDNGNYIQGTWDMPTFTDSVVGYRLFNDTRIRRNIREDLSNSIPVTNSCIWKLTGEGRREYTFGIQPFDKMAIRGERILETLYVPRLKAPSSLKLDVIYDGRDGNIHLSWVYPMSDDLLGFNIFLDGEMILSTNKVPPNTRSWILEGYPERSDVSYKLKYDIEAVFEWCSYKTPVPEIVWIGSNCQDRSIPAPKFFHAKPVGLYEGSRWISLNWWQQDDPDIAPRITKYMIHVANNSAFEDSQKILLNVCNEYYYEVPEKWIDSELYFKCSAVGENPSGGLYSLSSVPPVHSSWKKIIPKENFEGMKKKNMSNNWGQ